MTTRDRLSKLQRQLTDASTDFAVITSAQNVCYLTGYNAYPFDAGLNCIVVPKQGEITFVANDGENRLVSKLGWKTVSYESFSISKEIHQAESLVDMLLRIVGRGMKIGIEGEHLSSNAKAIFVEVLKPAELSDLSSTIMKMRITKDVDEVDSIRNSVKVAEEGVNADAPADTSGNHRDRSLFQSQVGYGSSSRKASRNVH